MTNQEIKDLFTKGYNVTIPAALPKVPAKTILICIIIPVIGWLVLFFKLSKIKKNKAAIEAAKAKQDELAKSLPVAYEKRITDFIGNGEARKKSGLAKTGLEEDQINQLKPIFFWGYNYGKKAFYRHTASVGDVSSIVEFTYIFFTADQVVVYKLTKDFYNDTKNEATTEYFYSDITNVRTGDSEIEKDGNTITFNTLSLIVPGDSYVRSVSSHNDQITNQVQGRKTLLRQKKTGSQNVNIINNNI